MCRWISAARRSEAGLGGAPGNPAGGTTTYRQIAERIGNPKAVRAVGTACGANPVSIVIPCHRAVREDGGLGGYRWGLERKKKLLDRESQ
ncbi:MAG: MGMT family protein [Isosphaeraceae bacterium]